MPPRPIADAAVLAERNKLRLICTDAQALAAGPIRTAIEASAHARTHPRIRTTRRVWVDLKKLAAGDFDD
ncbi:hypothetical protein KTE26_11290 [Ralstonia mannitolilytica]|jgi:hypothetical protein|uniref:hypothetical protein n=1 Tax=Ralstonia TaxID=48736 RepID=UPI0008EC7744|nr:MULTISPECIES: hypothetical protein [Ralstonia]MBU9579018.1 hypothetical protein [Ralstonia mannitolilytica]PLT18959.1 hypothetical protein CXP34_02925 [Ralstonia mannitolilytica]SFO89318.1 hypothetical protein SAMN03159417_00508 [Ralstonia sp. NFACC01]